LQILAVKKLKKSLEKFNANKNESDHVDKFIAQHVLIFCA